MMPAITFDTLKFAETLKDSGFDETQAKGMAKAIKEVQATHLEDLATKADILGVKGEIEAAELSLKGKIEAAELSLKGKIEAVELSLKGKIEAVELRFNSQLLLLKWMLGAIIAGVLSLVLKTFF